MNLFFRLIRIVIHAFFRSKLHFFDTSIVTFRVLPLDLDINRHMTNSRYLSVMDLGRIDLLIRTGVVKLTRKEKLGSVLGAATIRWRRGLRLFQKYELHTRIVAWDNKWFYLDQKILNDGHVITHAIVKAVFVRHGGSITTQELIEMLGESHIKSPEIPEVIKNWNASEEAMRQDAHAFATNYFNNNDHSISE